MGFGRRGRRVTRQALALLAALSVLASFVLAGHRYFYCALMNEVSLDTCCEPPIAQAQSDGPSIKRNACCTTERFAPATPGIQSHPGAALRAPLLVALGVESLRNAPKLPAVRAWAREARAGPGAPDPREHRLRLMVFLT